MSPVVTREVVDLINWYFHQIRPLEFEGDEVGFEVWRDDHEKAPVEINGKYVKLWLHLKYDAPYSCAAYLISRTNDWPGEENDA